MVLLQEIIKYSIYLSLSLPVSFCVPHSSCIQVSFFSIILIRGWYAELALSGRLNNAYSGYKEWVESLAVCLIGLSMCRCKRRTFITTVFYSLYFGESIRSLVFLSLCVWNSSKISLQMVFAQFSCFIITYFLGFWFFVRWKCGNVKKWVLEYKQLKI